MKIIPLNDKAKIFTRGRLLDLLVDFLAKKNLANMKDVWLKVGVYYDKNDTLTGYSLSCFDSNKNGVCEDYIELIA